MIKEYHIVIIIMMMMLMYKSLYEDIIILSRLNKTQLLKLIINIYCVLFFVVVIVGT